MHLFRMQHKFQRFQCSDYLFKALSCILIVYPKEPLAIALNSVVDFNAFITHRIPPKCHLFENHDVERAILFPRRLEKTAGNHQRETGRNKFLNVTFSEIGKKYLRG